jgi:glucose/mannose-6-phosphate isomerase
MSADLRALATEHDHADLAGVIERMPGQIEFALQDPAFPHVAPESYDRVVVAGMGGSALPVDVLLGCFPGRAAVPIETCRTYAYPRAGGRVLVIASSFSGNTEETISALEDQLRRGADAVVVTAGGRLAELADEHGLPRVTIPAAREGEDFQPRCATGYVATYLARILAAVGVLPEPAEELAAVPDFLRGLDLRTASEAIARQLGDRIPVVYTDDRHLMSVARITKIKFNEHAKRPAFFNALPEANHNETIGFSSPHGRFALLYLHDPDSHPRVARRFDVMEQVFAGAGHMAFARWTMPAGTAAQKVFACNTFGEWCAYTAALLGGIDPTPVPLVEDFKKLLD